MTSGAPYMLLHQSLRTFAFNIYRGSSNLVILLQPLVINLLQSVYIMSSKVHSDMNVWLVCRYVSQTETNLMLCSGQSQSGIPLSGST